MCDKFDGKREKFKSPSKYSSGIPRICYGKIAVTR
jgi:hypothetical protein